MSKRRWYMSIDCGPPRPVTEPNTPWPIFIVAVSEGGRFLNVTTFTTEEPALVCSQALRRAVDQFGPPDRLEYDRASGAFIQNVRPCAVRFNIMLDADELYHATMLECLLRRSNAFDQQFSSVEQFNSHLQKWVENHNHTHPALPGSAPKKGPYS
jgi:hypothetical protein